MVTLFLLKMFAGRDFAVRGNDLIMSYDDMCHLRRFIDNRRHLHPKLELFMQQVICPVIDCFHFDKNHKGKYCWKYCNPHSVAELEHSEDRNMSVAAEQRFKIVARHKHHMNRMNKTRFQFMLAYLVQLDHRFRELGQVG